MLPWSAPANTSVLQVQIGTRSPSFGTPSSRPTKRFHSLHRKAKKPPHPLIYYMLNSPNQLCTANTSAQQHASKPTERLLLSKNLVSYTGLLEETLEPTSLCLYPSPPLPAHTSSSQLLAKHLLHFCHITACPPVWVQGQENTYILPVPALRDSAYLFLYLVWLQQPPSPGGKVPVRSNSIF